MFLFITFSCKTLRSAVISEWPRVAPKMKLMHSPKLFPYWIEHEYFTFILGILLRGIVFGHRNVLAFNILCTEFVLRPIFQVLHYLYNTYLCLCMALKFFVGSWQFFSFLILYTVGRTPWMGDEPVARPLPTPRITQTQNKRTHTHPCLEWDSNTRSQCSSEWRQFMT
jgi:hypothetical protein